MRHVLLLDTETTDLSFDEGARAIEVACIVYDIRWASPLESFASLIFSKSNEAIDVNGINTSQLVDAPMAGSVWPRVIELAKKCDCIVAHRAEFDRKFVPDLEKPWACTKVDFKWPGKRKGDHLVQLALSYGVGVASAHRAMADVDIMARIFTRVAEFGHSLEEMFAEALRPKERFVAIVSFDDRQKAKDNGFLWEPSTKEWYRWMPPEDVKDLPFKVRES